MLHDAAGEPIRPLRLNLGAGDSPLPGFLNVDLCYPEGIAAGTPQPDGIMRAHGMVFPLGDVPDGAAEEVRASHILEHYPFAIMPLVLQEWVRVLRPGGWLRVAVPDFERIARNYLDGLDGRDVPDWPTVQYVMGGQTDLRDYHHCIFDEGELAGLLEALGLVDVRRWASEASDCAALPCSLNLMARKPGGALAPAPAAIAGDDGARSEVSPELLDGIKRDVFAVMSMPRLAFTDNAFCLISLANLGVRFERRQGCFWDQAMQGLFERRVEDGCRYILTVDYDTVFTPWDVVELYRLLEARPEIDALCPVQQRRDSDAPLFCTGQHRDGQGYVAVRADALQQDTMPILTGHFGLTLIRAAALERLPKPWFIHQPDEHGSYGEGRRDADIRFWHEWRAAGNSLHLANRLPVGHLQLLVTWADPTGKPVHQYKSEYDRNGKPGGIWR